MFGFSFDIFVNGDVSIGDDRLFKFTLTEQKHMAISINFIQELIQLHDGILRFSRAPTLSRHDLKTIIDYVTTAIV